MDVPVQADVLRRLRPAAINPVLMRSSDAGSGIGGVGLGSASADRTCTRMPDGFPPNGTNWL